MNETKFQKILDLSTWQRFEKITGSIFEENGFFVEVNKVISSKGKRRQFDVIAERGNLVLSVDCKRWNKNRYKNSAIKKAAEKHIERTQFLSEFKRKNAVPLIVTLFDESLYMHESVPVVPISKLNEFILGNF